MFALRHRAHSRGRRSLLEQRARSLSAKEQTMLKKLLLSTVFVAASALAASAMDVPTSAETCHKMLDEVTQTADPSKLPEDVLSKLDELMNTAEKQCEAGQFTEVVQTAETIQKELTAKN
jgi:hypothetical protein